MGKTDLNRIITNRFTFYLFILVLIFLFLINLFIYNYTSSKIYLGKSHECEINSESVIGILQEPMFSYDINKIRNIVSIIEKTGQLSFLRVKDKNDKFNIFFGKKHENGIYIKKKIFNDKIELGEIEFLYHLKDQNILIKSIILNYFLGTLIFFVLFYFLLKYLVNLSINIPIERVQEKIRKISQGDYEINKLDISEFPEYEGLLNNIDNMAEYIKDIKKHHDNNRSMLYQKITSIENSKNLITEHEEFLKATEKFSNIGGWRLDTKTKKIEWTDGMYDIFEVNRDYKPGMNNVKKRIHPDFYFTYVDTLYYSFENSTEMDLEIKIITGNNKEKWIRVKSIPTEYKGKKILAGFMQDISKFKQISFEVENIRNYLNNIINTLPFILIGVDSELEINILNNKALEYVDEDLEMVRGKSFSDIFSDFTSIVNDVKESINMKKNMALECSIKKDESYIYYNINILNHLIDGNNHAIIIIDDFTEKKKIEEMMIRSEKMLSLGGLAAGMAHEINNPLGGILQSVYNIKRRFDPNTEKNIKICEDLNVDFNDIKKYLDDRNIIKFLDGIEKASQRAGKIVSGMLSFSRNYDNELKKENINEIIETTLELAVHDYDFRRKFDFYNIDISKNFTENIFVKCVKNEIEQVILNIVKNAVFALNTVDKENFKPELKIQTYIKDGYAGLEILNNGPEIPPKIINKIFDPFFTTKDMEHGTGLGLAVSYYIIVEDHRGQFFVESNEDNTRFTILLPL